MPSLPTRTRARSGLPLLALVGLLALNLLLVLSASALARPPARTDRPSSGAAAHPVWLRLGHTAMDRPRDALPRRQSRP
ncbi:MAG TPA: hypothetical protein PLN91_06430 [Rhodanobacteraceae bacterium]|nr:hypothetical protein [Rhodanobacteraceae bacterium]